MDLELIFNFTRDKSVFFTKSMELEEEIVEKDGEKYLSTSVYIKISESINYWRIPREKTVTTYAKFQENVKSENFT